MSTLDEYKVSFSEQRLAICNGYFSNRIVRIHCSFLSTFSIPLDDFQFLVLIPLFCESLLQMNRAGEQRKILYLHQNYIHLSIFYEDSEAWQCDKEHFKDPGKHIRLL